MAKARIRNLDSEDHVLVGVRFRVIPSGDQGGSNKSQCRAKCVPSQVSRAPALNTE